MTLAIVVTTLCHSVDETMEILISPQQIEEKIKESGKQISQDYQGKPLTIIMIMKGAICVASDLIRNIDIPFTLEYVKASSYGQNGTTAGELTIAGFDNLNIEGRDVLLVDDIFETGKTITAIREKLKEKNPSSIKSYILLLKNVPRKTDYVPEYVLFNIEDRFVIGYGLDYKELYRGLPGIYAFIEDKPPF